MNCLHGVSTRELCPACAAAWKREQTTTPWVTIAKCPHGLATLQDGTDTTRVLRPSCVPCGTAPVAKRAVRR